MIQDIYPHKLDNQYKEKAPENNSKILYFQGNQILIHRTSQDELFLPEYALLSEADKKNAKLQYVFSMNDISYFLLWIREDIKQSDFPEGFGLEPVRTLRQLISKEVCFGVMTAWHLHRWYQDNQFCGRCGSGTVHDGKERMLRCPECGNMIFPKIAPAVIVCVTDGDRILMSKYADREYKKYALIAGFTEIGETAEETVAREVMEEVGLLVKNIRYYKSQPWGIDSNLLLGFFCELDGADKITMDTKELAVAQWFHRDEMPAQDDGISLTREMMGVFKNNEKV